LTNTLSVDEMATLSTPSGDAPRDPHDPKDPALLRRMGADPDVRAAWKHAFDLGRPAHGGMLVFSASMLSLLGGEREANVSRRPLTCRAGVPA
jgi:hypothetical protein